MAGKYIPMATSSTRKARKDTTVSTLVAPGLVEVVGEVVVEPGGDAAHGHGAGNHQQAVLKDGGLGHAALGEDGEDRRAHHDAHLEVGEGERGTDHEAGEDHSEGCGASVQDRRPQEHEDVHAGLKDLHNSDIKGWVCIECLPTGRSPVGGPSRP